MLSRESHQLRIVDCGLLTAGWHWRLVRQCLALEGNGALADKLPVAPGARCRPLQARNENGSKT